MLQSDEVYIHNNFIHSQFRWGSIEFVAESGDTLSYCIAFIYDLLGHWCVEGHHRGKRSITLHLTYNVFDLPFHHCKIIKLLHQRKDAGKLYTVSTLYLCFVLLWYYILLLLNLLSLLFFSSLPFSPFSLSFFPPFLSSFFFFPLFPAKKYLFSREPVWGGPESERS